MKKRMILLMSVLSVSATVLAGCTVDTRVGEESHHYEYDEDSGKFEEKGEYDDYGFDSSDDTVDAFWKAFAECSEDDMLACFPSKDVANDGAEPDIEDAVGELIGQAEKVMPYTEIDLDDIETDSEKMDVDDLKDDFLKAFDIEKAKLITVVVPMTQTIDGVVYEVEDKYTMTVAQIHDRWFVLLCDEEGAEIISTSEGDGTVSAEPDSDKPELPTVPVGDNGEEPSGETWVGSTDGEWCSINKSSDSISVTYTTGISDSFEIADGVTFDDLCDWLDYASDNFERDTYRRVVSLYFGSPEYYSAMWGYDVDTQSVVLGKLAYVANTINKVDGNVTAMRVNSVSSNIYIYDMTCPQYGSCSLYVDDKTGEMTLYQYETGNTSDGQMENDALAVWVTAAGLALSGEAVN